MKLNSLWIRFPYAILLSMEFWNCESVGHSVTSDSLWPHGLWPARILCPWNSPARILQWVAMLFSRGSSCPRDRTLVSHIAGWFFTSWEAWHTVGTGCWCSREHLSHDLGWKIELTSTLAWSGRTHDVGIASTIVMMWRRCWMAINMTYIPNMLTL